MTSITAVEDSITECRRYMERAERALASLRAGQDNNKDTSAMKRGSMDLTNALVAVRGRADDRRERRESRKTDSPSPELPTMEEVEKDIKEHTKADIPTGTHPDPSQFLCSECGCLVDLHKMVSRDLTEGQKVCESCFHSNTYQSRKAKESEQTGQVQSQKPLENEQKPPKAEQRPQKWKNTPGSSRGEYRCLADEMIEVRYGSCTPIKTTWAEIWELVDCNGSITDKIRQLLGDIITTNKVSAVRSFVNAVRAGQIPEAPEVA